MATRTLATITAMRSSRSTIWTGVLDEAGVWPELPPLTTGTKRGWSVASAAARTGHHSAALTRLLFPSREQKDPVNLL